MEPITVSLLLIALIEGIGKGIGLGAFNAIYNKLTKSQDEAELAELLKELIKAGKLKIELGEEPQLARELVAKFNGILKRQQFLETGLRETKKDINHCQKELVPTLLEILKDSKDVSEWTSRQKLLIQLLKAIVDSISADQIEKELNRVYQGIDQLQREEKRQFQYRNPSTGLLHRHHSLSYTTTPRLLNIRHGFAPTTDKYEFSQELYELTLTPSSLYNDTLAKGIFDILNNKELLLNIEGASDDVEPLLSNDVFAYAREHQDHTEKYVATLYDMELCVKDNQIKQIEQHFNKLQETSAQTTRDLKRTKALVHEATRTIADILATDSVADEVRNDFNADRLFTLDQILEYMKNPYLPTSVRFGSNPIKLAFYTDESPLVFRFYGNKKVSHNIEWLWGASPSGSGVIPIAKGSEAGTPYPQLSDPYVDPMSHDLTKRQYHSYRRGEQSLECLKRVLVGSQEQRQTKIDDLFRKLRVNQDQQSALWLRCALMYSVNYQACEGFKTEITDEKHEDSELSKYLLNTSYYTKTPNEITKTDLIECVKNL